MTKAERIAETITEYQNAVSLIDTRNIDYAEWDYRLYELQQERQTKIRAIEQEEA